VHPAIERARAALSGWRPAPMSAAQEAAFDDYCRGRFARLTTTFAVSTLVCAAVWWPADYLVYRALPEYIRPFQIWRAVICAIAAVHLATSWVPALRPSVVARFAVEFVIVCATMGYGAGLLRGPEGVQFHLLYVLGFATVPLPVRLSTRVVMTAAFCAAVVLGCVVPFPALRGSPHLFMAISFLVWICGISVTFGHATFLALRAHFVQAAELAEANTSLEARVAERTRELRELLSRLETTREEERGRIARELHDQLGQELMAQRLTLEIAEECLDGEPATARAKLVEMRNLLGGMMGTVRALIGDLRPWILHDLGLGEAAQWLARRTEELAGVRCELTVVGDPTTLDPERSAAVFRILQESLTNVTKHAHATRVAIDLATTDDALVLRVRDDGIGPAAPGSKGGFGVLGMRERAHALGGDLALRGLPGGGTEVTCHLPQRTSNGATP
jgi:signal transduction histidine kinase